MTPLTDTNYVELAENVIKSLEKNKQGSYTLTMTQIRNLLSLTSELYDAVHLRGYEAVKSQVTYLRVQFLYQAGRDEGGKNSTGVKDFVEKSGVLNHLASINDKESLIRFCRYMESLVAYFKYLGGKEK